MPMKPSPLPGCCLVACFSPTPLCFRPKVKLGLGNPAPEARLHLCCHLQAHHSMNNKWSHLQKSLLALSYLAWAPPSHLCNLDVHIFNSENFPQISIKQTPISSSSIIVSGSVMGGERFTLNQEYKSNSGKPVETRMRWYVSEYHSCLWKSLQLLGAFNPHSLLTKTPAMMCRHREEPWHLWKAYQIFQPEEPTDTD